MVIQQFEILKVVSGFVGLGWAGDRLTCLRLPEATAEAAIRAVKRRLPSAQRATIPDALHGLRARIEQYFDGAVVAFDDIEIDLGPQNEFFAEIYAHVRAIPYGQTSTYGAIAKQLGRGPEAARDVGVAMAKNPIPLIVPCHRVCGAGGKIGGFSAPGGSVTKAVMLALEGAAFPEMTRNTDGSQFTFVFPSAP